MACNTVAHYETKTVVLQGVIEGNLTTMKGGEDAAGNKGKEGMPVCAIADQQLHDVFAQWILYALRVLAKS